MNNLISILLPVKNAAHFLTQTLDSILNQKEVDWELIAVNDHSDDQSFAILTAYSKKDTRIKVFQNIGNGIIPALRLAYKNAMGNLITRMDADDIMPLIKLNRLKNLLLKNGPGHLATGKVKYFSADGIGPGYQRYTKWLNQLCESNTHYQAIYKECVIPSPCWMLFREDLDRVGAFIPNTYPEDYDLVFRFYKHGLKVVSCEEILHLWRDHSERSSRTDPNYAQFSYLELKISYYLELDFDSNRPLVIWSVGKKGKKIAKKLIERGQNFHWITSNKKKIGLNIYGKLIEDQATLHKIINPQIIILVGNPDEQDHIRKQLDTIGLLEIENYRFFC